MACRTGLQQDVEMPWSMYSQQQTKREKKDWYITIPDVKHVGARVWRAPGNLTKSGLGETASEKRKPAQAQSPLKIHSGVLRHKGHGEEEVQMSCTSNAQNQNSIHGAASREAQPGSDIEAP